MAKKDVYKYYEQIQEQYVALSNEIEEANKLVLEPEVAANLEAMMNPLKENYKRISYIIWLLNKPKFRWFKSKRYKDNEPLFLEYLKGDCLEDIKLENSDILKRVKEEISKLKGNK